MIKTLLSTLIFIVSLQASAQDTTKNNPVIFAEIFPGLAKGRAGGFAGGAELNFQIRRNFFSVRWLGALNLNLTKSETPFLPFGIEEGSGALELATLYGWRFVDGRKGYNFSLGLSHNRYYEYYRDEEDQTQRKDMKYLGLPFEANIKWFKDVKKKFRVLGFVPVGPKTAFGGSIGLKLFGNISKNPYCGVGIAYGLGYHREY